MARDWDADLKDLEKLQKDLVLFSKKSVPFAMRNALNDTAVLGQRLWQRQMKKSFTLRNKFTANSVKVQEVKRGMNPDAMFSILGSISPYMGLQESGGTKKGKTGAVAIPTAVAARQAKGSKRTRPVTRANQIRNINLSRRIRGGSKAQRNAANVRQAAARGFDFALITREGGKRAIVRVKQGKKNISVRMVWDLSRRSVRIKPSPTLQPTLAKLERLRPAIHRRAIINELRFRKILGF